MILNENSREFHRKQPQREAGRATMLNSHKRVLKIELKGACEEMTKGFKKIS
jgi:hypothetical protein